MAEGKRGLWWWIDRWRRSPPWTDMSLAEQGGYRNLLDEQRLRGGRIPNDERVLAKACGDPLEWPVIREKVLAKFDVSEDGQWLSNRTATEVNAVSDSLSEAQAAKGKARAAGAARVKGRFTSPASRSTSRKTSQPPAEEPAAPPASVSVAVSVSGSVTGSVSETENGSSGADAPAALTTTPPPEEKPWNLEATDVWERHLGSVNAGKMGGRIGAALKPLLQKHGWGPVRELWERACEQAASEADPEYFTPEVFARTFSARMRAPPAKARGRSSVGERQLGAVAAFLERKGGKG
jgi:uncharacterized protein YdaU (DUF1376 family)